MEEFSIGATGTIQGEMIGSEVHGEDANGTVRIVEDAMVKVYRPVIRPKPGEPDRASSTPL